MDTDEAPDVLGDDEVEFGRTGPGSKVHVLHPSGPATEPTGGFAATMAGWMLDGAPTGRSLCGRVLRRADGGHRIDAFADEELCVACYHAVPVAHRHRLFEHPQE